MELFVACGAEHNMRVSPVRVMDTALWCHSEDEAVLWRPEQASGCTPAQAMPSVVRKDPDPANLYPKNSAVARKSRPCLFVRDRGNAYAVNIWRPVTPLENVSAPPCDYMFLVPTWLILRESSGYRNMSALYHLKQMFCRTLCLYKSYINWEYP